MQGAKSYEISKQLVWEAYRKVKSNNGAAGIDSITIADFEKDLKNNLYRVWNRMSSGCYFPSAVRMIEIPKSDGRSRTLGIPTVEDRIAQMVVVMSLEPSIDPHFHKDSYGYRSGKSAHHALAAAKQRCRDHRWVIDLDVHQFFDSIDHDLLLKAVEKHTDQKWIMLYIQRWITVPYKLQDGTIVERTKGIAQGSVIGPLLSNLFLHYAIDEWMKRIYPHIPFERYADDIICHCVNKQQSEKVLESIRNRLIICKLELNESKTRIVYCKDSNRKEDHEIIQFDFLGHTFKPRHVMSAKGEYFTGFNPAVSKKSLIRISDVIRSWDVNQWVGWSMSLKEIAHKINPLIRGWINYYGKFYPTVLRKHFRYIDLRLASWVRTKFKRFKRHKSTSIYWLGKQSRLNPELFAHWQWGYKPPVGK